MRGRKEKRKEEGKKERTRMHENCIRPRQLLQRGSVWNIHEWRRDEFFTTALTLLSFFGVLPTFYRDSVFVFCQKEALSTDFSVCLCIFALWYFETGLVSHQFWPECLCSCWLCLFRFTHEPELYISKVKVTGFHDFFSNSFCVY